MGGLLYTEEQVTWIDKNRNKYPDPNDMVKEFNRLFNSRRTLASISNLCRHRKLVKSNYKKPTEADKHINETRLMNCRLHASITTWRGYGDIDVRFENGVLKEHTNYSSFKDGTLTPASKLSIEDFAKDHLHEKKKMNCGYECEIVAIRSKKDIDVKWYEGTVTQHRDYKEFEQGIIRIPARAKWLHQKAVMNCGLMAEVIEFFNTSDILVKFEDGYEIHSTTASWAHRTVDNPNVSKKAMRLNRVHERRLMNSGLWGTIFMYRGINDVDVEFDDGMKNCGVTYTNFSKGSVTHPLMNGHYKSPDFHGYILEGRVMVTGDDALYKVVTPDGSKELMYISKVIELANQKSNQ